MTQTRHDSQQTRDDLLYAAVKLFTEHGLSRPSVTDIANKAGYARSVFYTHFKDKEDVVGAVIEFTVTAAAHLAAAGEPGNVASLMANFVAAALRKEWPIDGTAGWRFYHTLEACVRSPSVRKRYLVALEAVLKQIRDVVAAGQAMGTVRRDVKASALARILLGMSFGVISAAHVDMDVDFADLVTTVAKLLAPL